MTREITAKSRDWSAADAYAAVYRLKELERVADAMWANADCAITPTAGTHYRIDAVEADPIRLNATLGYYTNFMNLLDYAATAVPAGFVPGGLPFGVTLFAPAHQDVPLLGLAAKMQRAAVTTTGATGVSLPAAEAVVAVPALSGQVRVAVCGAHMSGLPLNPQLTSRGARLVCATASAPVYRFYALPGGPPMRPGMVRVADGGDRRRGLGVAGNRIRQLRGRHSGTALHRHRRACRRQPGAGLRLRGLCRGGGDGHHRTGRVAHLPCDAEVVVGASPAPALSDGGAVSRLTACAVPDR